MNLLLRPLVSGKPAAEQFSGLPAHCKDPLGFTWWLVTHLAMLGQYSRNGTLQSEVRNSIIITPVVITLQNKYKSVSQGYHQEIWRDVFLSGKSG